MPFRTTLLFQGLALAAIADAFLLWYLPQVLEWHSRMVESLLRLANVPWEKGRSAMLLPGISGVLVRTASLDYRAHPLYPGFFTVGALACFGIGYRRWPGPLKPLLFLLPASLAITFIYLQTVSPVAPYTPEDFCGMWYRGETYIWLLLPLIFSMSFFILNVPFSLKIGWLAILLLYSFGWSAVRLALALGTFHYFGSIWMPFFYFVFGFLTDFLYIVAFYSLAMDQAAAFLAREKEIWQ